MNNADMPAAPLGKDGSFKNAIGLTKREHFAGLAMQGLCSVCDSDGCWTHNAGMTATAAIEYADALLAELDKGQK
jgi:hypothetical protein